MENPERSIVRLLPLEYAEAIERRTTREALLRTLAPMTTTTEKTSGSGALVATRALSGIVAALVFTQGALAGSHLSGVDGVIGVHGAIGSTLPLLAIVIVVTAAASVRQNRWVLPASIVGMLAMGLQTGMGYMRQLQIHVPLGIALFGTYLIIACLARPRDNQPKEER